MSIIIRCFDIYNEDINKLFDLYKSTYNETINFKKWVWKYKKNPNSKDLRIYVAEAENDNTLAGATYRLPYTLIINEKLYLIYFNVDSMVHNKFRRQGIMNKLYEKACSDLPVTLSKGTMPNMYNLLMKMGFKPLYPNTFLMTVLSFPKWFLLKLNTYKQVVKWNDCIKLPMIDYYEIKSFGNEFDIFFNKIKYQYDGIIMKNSEYMNWRYFYIPHKTYKVFYRKNDDTIISVIILGLNGTTGKIIDILWDKSYKDEPYYTLKFAKKYMKNTGAITLKCWTTYSYLRKILRKNYFIDRNETPNFSFYCSQNNKELFKNVNHFLFCEGDGDSEFG